MVGGRGITLPPARRFCGYHVRELSGEVADPAGAPAPTSAASLRVQRPPRMTPFAQLSRLSLSGVPAGATSGLPGYCGEARHVAGLLDGRNSAVASRVARSRRRARSLAVVESAASRSQSCATLMVTSPRITSVSAGATPAIGDVLGLNPAYARTVRRRDARASPRPASQ